MQHAKTESEINATCGKGTARQFTGGKRQSATSPKTDYSVGDVVFWGTPTTREYTFIGHPRGGGKVLMLTAN